MLADKIRAKDFVRDRLGPEWIIPTLWHGTELPDVPRWPRPFVVKSRHGCNQNAFVLTDAEDWPAIRERARRWMRNAYGYWLDEWLYRDIPRGILIEPFIGSGSQLPIDYKLFVFAGRVEYVQVHLGRGTRHHRWIVLDRSWHRVSSASLDPDPARPSSLGAMIAGAEQLGRGISFVRVDLYDGVGRPLFGEMTFYPGSGLDRFDPVALDGTMGEHWLHGLFRLPRASLIDDVAVPARSTTSGGNTIDDACWSSDTVVDTCDQSTERHHREHLDERSEIGMP